MTDDRLMELEHELEHITWDVMGLSEVRRKGVEYMTLKSGHQFFHSGSDVSQAGVGFLKNKALAGNVVEVKGINERICKLVLQLNKKCKVNIVQVYAPTSSHEDEVVEEFYDKVSAVVDSCTGNKTFVIGDFNAKVGRKEQGERTVGNFGLGERNSRGQMLVEFAAQNKMKIMNTFFQKPQKRKWTWQGPNRTVKNEIDFILTTRPDVVNDVKVITRANTGSDHRPVVAKIRINTRCERRKMVKRPRTINKDALIQHSAECRVQLANRFETLTTDVDIDQHCTEISEAISEVAVAVAGYCKARPKKEKLSEATKKLMTKRREMKREGNIQHIEYREVCKTIRKKSKRGK